jgi:serine/threonine protein kinase
VDPVVNEKQISNCLIATPNSLLFMDNGMKSLKSYITQSPTKPELLEVLRGLVNIFDGVEMMNNKNAYHHDIKADNIVIGGPSGYRLIDLGLSSIYDTDNIYDKHRVFNALYFVWPFDIVYIKRDKLRDDERTIRINDYINSYIAYIDKPDKENLIRVSKELETLRPKDRKRLILEKSDVHGLGVLLKYVILTLPRSRNLDLRNNLEELVYDMTNIDPRIRLTIKEAKRRFKTIVSSI